MNAQLMLSEREWGLVRELLERERGDLPAEIRHCRNQDFRHGLRDRLRMVDDLIRRVRAEARTAPGSELTH